MSQSIISFKKGHNYISFEEAKDIVRKNNMSKRIHWDLYYINNKNIVHIPRFPDIHYKKLGWVSWEDFIRIAAGMVGEIFWEIKTIREELLIG